jgi:hypothetical protein
MHFSLSLCGGTSMRGNLKFIVLPRASAWGANPSPASSSRRAHLRKAVVIRRMLTIDGTPSMLAG